MKSLIATILLALAATSANAAFWTNFREAFVSGIKPFASQIHEGHEVQVFTVNVTVPGLTRASAGGQTVTYYATSLVDTFLSGFSFCKTKQWELATPKTEEDEAALEALMAQFKFPENAWLGSICGADKKWFWLSDSSWLNYNNFMAPGGAVQAPPECDPSRQDALIILTDIFNNFGRWFKWYAQDATAKNHVICQA